MGAHADDPEHFPVSNNLRFDIGEFFGKRKIFPLLQLVKIFVDGDQDILDEFDIADFRFNNFRPLLFLGNNLEGNSAFRLRRKVGAFRDELKFLDGSY